jgi:tetratricopeptide (TPR) repeat protein
VKIYFYTTTKGEIQMENLIDINLNGEIITITDKTPFPILLAEFLYEGDFDLMMADLKNNVELVEEAKKVTKLMENLPGLTSNFITRPFVFNDFMTYMDEFKIKPSDLNHVSLNGMFDIVLERADRKAFDMVKKIIDFMLKIDSNFAPAYELLGSILIEEGDFEKGKEYLEKAAKIDPWNIAALSELGEAYFNLKEFNKAAEIWKKEIELSPDNYVTYFMISDAYIEIEEFEKAAHNLEKFLSRFPKSILGKFELSELYRKLGRNIEADELKDEILNSTPEYQSDIEIWSKIMIEKQKFDRVIKFIEKYIRGNDENEHLKLLLVVPYIKSGRKSEAKEIYKTMKEKFSWYIYSLKNVFDENLNDEERELLN